MKLNAKQYDAWYLTPFGKYADKLEKKLVFKFTGDISGKRVLDAGCGTGNYTVELANRGASVVGLDTSIEMINAAREKSVKSGPAVFVRGSMSNLPFKSNAYDLAISVTSLEFCKGDAAEAVREIKRAVKEGAIFGVLNKWSVYALEKKIISRFKETVYKDARFYSASELKNLFGEVKWESTLFALDFMPAWFLRFFSRFERITSAVLKPFGAFIVVKWERV